MKRIIVCVLAVLGSLTVLFVSHDMEAIRRICNSVMWINAGQVMKLGEPEVVVDEYQNAIWSQAGDHAGLLSKSALVSVRRVMPLPSSYMT